MVENRAPVAPEARSTEPVSHPARTGYVFATPEPPGQADCPGYVFGLLLGLAISFDLYAVTNWSNITVAFVEPIVSAIRIALAGAVIGWTLGMGSG